MLDAKSYVYLSLAGCLLGFGLLVVFSSGLPFILLGMLLVLYGVKRAGGRGFWVSLICMSIVPVLYFSANYFFNNYYSNLALEGFLGIVLLFMIPAAVGVVWGLVETNRAKGRPHSTSAE